MSQRLARLVFVAYLVITCVVWSHSRYASIDSQSIAAGRVHKRGLAGLLEVDPLQSLADKVRYQELSQLSMILSIQTVCTGSAARRDTVRACAGVLRLITHIPFHPLPADILLHCTVGQGCTVRWLRRLAPLPLLDARHQRVRLLLPEPRDHR